MIFDTHCHPYLNKQKNWDKTIEDFFENGWKYINIIWTNLETTKKAIDSANKYDGVYASIWIHPCDIVDLDLEETMKKLEKIYLENKDKVVAVWECWLDYYRLERDKEIKKLAPEYKQKAIELKKDFQKIFFKAHILLAKEYDLPLIIHNRESKDDVLEILKEVWYKNFIFHCYSEDLEYANSLIEFSPICKISFSWIVTFSSAKEVQDTAKNIPLQHILAETDAPYLTPTPYRWKQENEPYFTKYVVKKINELRWEDCSKQILQNSLEVFGLTNKKKDLNYN